MKWDLNYLFSEVCANVIQPCHDTVFSVAPPFYHKLGAIRNVLKTPLFFLGLVWCIGRWRQRELNLVPRGPFCHALEKSGPLARSNDIPVLNGFLNTID